jgi:mono/diheme cytochrome c family protein
MKLSRRYHIVLGLLAVFMVMAAGGVYYMTAHGFSAHDEPTFVEAAVARQMRHMAVPRGARVRPNPMPDTPESIAAGLEHFADHCALCHANDGSGHTEIGRNLYPKAPDMRQAQTQKLSDGELFYIIENGVRLTGMPAWATGPEGEKGSWTLVRFIRHLPQLTEEDRKQMEQLNPRPPGEMNMLSEDDFLNGKDAPGKPSAASVHGGHRAGKQ